MKGLACFQIFLLVQRSARNEMLVRIQPKQQRCQSCSLQTSPHKGLRANRPVQPPSLKSRSQLQLKLQKHSYLSNFNTLHRSSKSNLTRLQAQWLREFASPQRRSFCATAAASKPTPTKYDEVYQRSLQQPEAFWSEAAKEIDWYISSFFFKIIFNPN